MVGTFRFLIFFYTCIGYSLNSKQILEILMGPTGVCLTGRNQYESRITSIARQGKARFVFLSLDSFRCLRINPFKKICVDSRRG